MQFSSEGMIIFFVLLASGLMEFLFVWVFNYRRKKIINMGHDATATVVDIVERKGLKGNKYYESVLRYQTVLGKSITVKNSTIGKPSAYAIGGQVALYYHPDKPEKFVLKNDPRARLINIVFISIGTLMLIGAIVALLLV